MNAQWMIISFPSHLSNTYVILHPFLFPPTLLVTSLLSSQGTSVLHMRKLLCVCAAEVCWALHEYSAPPLKDEGTGVCVCVWLGVDAWNQRQRMYIFGGALRLLVHLREWWSWGWGERNAKSKSYTVYFVWVIRYDLKADASLVNFVGIEIFIFRSYEN